MRSIKTFLGIWELSERVGSLCSLEKSHRVWCEAEHDGWGHLASQALRAVGVAPGTGVAGEERGVTEKRVIFFFF